MSDERQWCWLCGKPIDPSLPRNHPMAGTVDHVRARARGGSEDGLEKDAISCNSP